MKPEFYLNRKKISRKQLEQMVKPERVERMVKEAIEIFHEDPYTEIAWTIADGYLQIIF